MFIVYLMPSKGSPPEPHSSFFKLHLFLNKNICTSSVEKGQKDGWWRLLTPSPLCRTNHCYQRYSTHTEAETLIHTYLFKNTSLNSFISLLLDELGYHVILSIKLLKTSFLNSGRRQQWVFPSKKIVKPLPVSSSVLVTYSSLIVDFKTLVNEMCMYLDLVELKYLLKEW